MSVIVENKHDNTIELLCKGADMMIIDRLAAPDKALFAEEDSETNKLLEEFSSAGLRTLCLAKKILKRGGGEGEDGAFYDNWSQQWKEASML